MRYTFRDILNSYTKEKKKKSSFWARMVSRPLSFLFTYFFINLGFSPNTVSVLSIIDAVIGCILIMLGGKWVYIGVIMFVFWHVLDCVDGNIARVKKESSYGGAFLDAVSGYVAPSFIFLAVGSAAYLTTKRVPEELAHFLIVLGGFSSASDNLTRLIYQRYLVTEYRLGLVGQEGDIDEERASGIKHIADLIMKHMGYSSLFMPLLILSAVYGTLDLLTLVYAFYNAGVLVSTMVLFIAKANKLEQRMEALGLQRPSDVKEF